MLKEATLSNFTGKIKLITSFPSLDTSVIKGNIKLITFLPFFDTSVCALQVKEFNKRARRLHPEVVILGISKDLPFAQKRFCQANNIKNLVVLSDYRFSSFGINYGLLIKEPELPIKEEAPLKCKPCEGGIAPLTKETVDRLIAQYSGWQLIEDKKLVKEFRFKDFVEAKYFLDLVSVIAEEQKHHPTMTIIYNKLRITLTTHAAGGITENDFIMAKIIDELGSQE